MPQAKYGTNILVDFNCIVDIDFAIIQYLQKNCVNEKYMKSYVLHGSDYFIKCLLLQRKNINPVSIIIKDEYIDSADDILEEILEEHYDEILNIITPTAIFGLIVTYVSIEESGIHCDILCKNQQQEQYIKNINPLLTTIRYDKGMSVRIYDSVFIKVYEEILTFSDFGGKYAYLMNYSYNLEENEKGVELPKKLISALITDVNRVFTIDPYVDFKLPQKIIIKGEDVK